MNINNFPMIRPLSSQLGDIFYICRRWNKRGLPIKWVKFKVDMFCVFYFICYDNKFTDQQFKTQNNFSIDLKHIEPHVRK